MNNNERFDRIKAKHPDWSDDQVWMAVSLDLQQDATIEQNKDVDPNDPNIWKTIVTKAKGWLQEVLPVVFEKVKEIFGDRDKELKADLLCRKAAKLIAENAKEAKAEKKATKSRKKADKAEDNKAE